MSEEKFGWCITKDGVVEVEIITATVAVFVYLTRENLVNMLADLDA